MNQSMKGAKTDPKTVGSSKGAMPTDTTPETRPIGSVGKVSQKVSAKPSTPKGKVGGTPKAAPLGAPSKLMSPGAGSKPMAANPAKLPFPSFKN